MNLFQNGGDGEGGKERGEERGGRGIERGMRSQIERGKPVGGEERGIWEEKREREEYRESKRGNWEGG